MNRKGFWDYWINILGGVRNSALHFGAIALAQQRIKGKSKISPNCLRQLLLSAIRSEPRLDKGKKVKDGN